MKESLVSRLRAARRELVERIVDDEHFWNHLVSNGTITSEHLQRCQAKNSKMERIELLLDMMERRDDPCFEKFCQALYLKNVDLVKKYLDVHHYAEPSVSTTQTVTDGELNGTVLLDRLEKLRGENVLLFKRMEEETEAVSKLEIVNTDMQNKYEEAVSEVKNLERQHRKNEDDYESNVKGLDAEKVLITQLEKEKELLDAEISRQKEIIDENNKRKAQLEEELNAKSQENRKLGRQVSFHKTHLSSLGSRSFSEDV